MGATIRRFFCYSSNFESRPNFVVCTITRLLFAESRKLSSVFLQTGSWIGRKERGERRNGIAKKRERWKDGNKEWKEK